MVDEQGVSLRKRVSGVIDSSIVFFRRLLEPLTVSIEPEPFRGRMVPRRLAGQIDLLQSFLVLLTIIVETWIYGQLKSWIVISAILGYLFFIFGYRWLIALGPEKWRAAAGQVNGIVVRAVLLMVANGIFLWLLYTQTDHLQATNGQSSLWLLFVFANLNMLRRRRIGRLVGTTVIAIVCLAPSLYVLTTQYLEQSIFFFVQQLMIRGLWIAVLSYVFYGTLSIIDAKVQAFLIVQRLTGEWYGLRDARQLAEKVTDELTTRFGFHQAQVFIHEGDRLVMMAAGTPEASHLVDTGFTLELPQGNARPISLNAACFQSGKPITVNDVHHDQDYKDRYFDHNVFEKTRAEMCVPLFRGDRVIGTLDVMSHRVNDFIVPNDEELLMTIAGSLGTAMSNALDAERLEQQRQSLEIVELLSKMSFSVIDLPEVMDEIVQRARAWSRADLVTLYEIAATADYTIRSGPYQSGELHSPPLSRPGEASNFIVEVAKGGKPVFIDDTSILEIRENDSLVESRDRISFRNRENVVSVAALPLLRGGSAVSFGEGQEQLQVIGVLIFNYRTRQRIEWDEDRRNLFIKFASLASLAMQRSTLSETEAGELIERRFRDIHDFLLSRVSVLLAMTGDRMAEEQDDTHWHALYDELVELRNAAKSFMDYKVGLVGAEALDRRVTRFINQLRRDFPTRQFHLSLPSEEQMKRITAVAAEHLTAICYEAITNSIRHGKATEFWVQFSPDEDGGWTFIVEDNGVGFTADSIDRRGGWRHIEQRVKELTGTWTIVSDPIMGGTSLLVSFAVSG